ncbi:hypothetical protein HU200_020465 [Digitaria exilis]|uniref:AIG1-type G domain-containing protein n=1 Tax=Digitaria exilis TaxID=1010633 RepID=A0A835F1W5_9POAL|nr:hypothetical protein HU200_020465 [Digitaria exilis]
MATATNTARGAPMEEENPAPKIEEKDPLNKSEVAMTTTTGQAFVMPLEDKKSTMLVEEVPMIVKVAEKGTEAAKKGVASGKYKEEDEELERKDRGHVGLEDKNGEEEGGRGGDDHMKVEEAKTDGKVRILGVVEAMKNDDSGEIAKDIEFFGSMVEALVMLGVEKKKDNSELGDGTNFLASHDEVEGEDKSELLKEEQQKEQSGVIVEAKVEGDVESIVVEEEKPEPKGQKGEDVGFGGRDGGNFIEEKVTKASSVRIEAVELDVNVAPFPKANDALGYDKEATNDAMVVGGEEITKESIGNDTNIEYETTKSKQGNKTGTMAMNDGSVEEVAQEKTNSMLDDCPTRKDVDGQVIASEVEDEVGVASEEEVAYKVLDDVESTMIDKEKQKQEGEKNEEVGSLGGNDGELKGKDVEVLVLSFEVIEMEDKLASLAETSEKFSYAMQGSNNIVDVNEGSVPEVTLGSAYHMPKDISKEYNAEGQATASETEEEVHIVLEMSVVEKVENDERYLLDKDVKPKLESAKGKDIGSGGSDGGKLDEEKEAKVSVASMFVESQVGAMVVNGRSIDGVDMACEDSMLMGSSEKNRNTEDQTTENELKEEVHVILESNVTYKVSDDTEFDMAEDEKGEPEGEKSEEMEYVGGNGGKLDRGKDIKVFTDSAEVIELEDKLVPLAETNEKFGYVKEGSDDAVLVNEGNAYEVTPASAYSMLEDISKKEHSVDSQATSSEADKVGVVVEMYVADKLPIDAKSLLAKGEEGGSGGRDGSELDEEKEAEVSVVTTVFVEPEADAMVVNDRIIGEFSLASEDTMLVGSPKKKQNFEGRTTSHEIKEEVHVVGDSSMDGEKKAKAEGKNSEDIGFVSGNGSKLGEGKDVEVFLVTIEDTELEQKLAHLGETNENFGYAEERRDDLVDVNKGSVEVVIPASTCSLLEGISKKKHNVEGQATTSEAEEELGVVMDMYVPDKMSDDAKTLLAKEEKPILKGMENEEVGSGAWDGVEFDEKEAKVSISSIVFVEPEASAMVVINKSIDEIDFPCEDSVSVGSLENKQSAKGQITKIEVKEEVHVVVEPEVIDKVSDDIESNMDDEEKPKPECDKGEKIGSICGNVGDLDEEKDIEVFSVSVEAIELKDKLDPVAGTNENFGYEKEGSDDIVDVNEGSVEEVTPSSVFSALEDIYKKEYNAKGRTTMSDAKEDVRAIAETSVVENMPHYAKSLLPMEDKSLLECVEGKKIGSQGRDGAELDEEGEVKVSVVSIAVVEPEAGAMVENDRSTEEVALANEDDVLVDCPEMKQGDESQITKIEVHEEVNVVVESEVINMVHNDTYSYMADEEIPEPQGDKSEEIGSIGGNGGELDERKDIEAISVSVEAIELNDKLGPLAEANEKIGYEKEGSNDILEEEPKQEGVKGEKGDSRVWDGVELGEEKEAEVSVGRFVFVEQETCAMVVNDRNKKEVDLACEDIVLMGRPEKKQNTESHMVEEEKAKAEGEKGKEIGFVGGNGGELDEEKDVEVFTVSDEVTELEDNLAHLSGTNEEVGYVKEESDDIVVMDEGSVERVTPKSSYYVLEDISKKENSVEGQATTSEAEDIGVVVEMYVASNVPDDVKSLIAKEENPNLEGLKVEEVGYVGRGGGGLNEKEDEVFVASVVFFEPDETEQKVELEGDKSEEVGSICGDGDESDKEKKDKVSVVNIEAIQFEHKLASIAKTNFKLGYEKKIRDDIVVVGDEEVPKEPTKKDIDIEKETSNPEPSSEASTMVVNDGSLDELAPTSADSVLECSPIKELNFEPQSIASEAMKDGVEKPSKVENIATAVQDLGVEKSIEVENIVGAVKGIDVEKLIKDENVNADNSDGTLSLELPPKSIKENNDAEEIKGATDVVHREREFDDDIITEIVIGYEDGFGNEGNEDDDESNADTSPTPVAIFESNEATKQVMKENVEGSSIGMSSSRNFTNSMGGKIMLDASKDDGDEKGVDSTTHATVLNSENCASSDENVIISSQDGSKILAMDRPAGMGSLAPSLRPTTPNLLVSSDLAAIIANPTEEMTEEERKLHDKVELIRVKFMRLVYSLGATPNEMVVTQVLYRLGLVEGIMHGRQAKQASDLNNAWKKALSLEGEGENDLNFSCNILVLGKTGVGKSATINSIFGKEKSKTDAFNSATTSVQEIVGDVHGVKIRIIDTPGLQPSVMDQGSNRKVLAAIKKYTKKCPPDIVLYVDRLDCLSRDLNDLPLLKTITSVLGPSIWLNAIVALTHAASAPEDLNGAHMTYEVLMAQTSHIIQKSIRQATGDMNLMNPVAFAENHSSCQRNHEDQKVLPNGERWRHQILLLCYSAKILSEANSLVKLNDPNDGNLFGLCFCSVPLPFLMSSLLEPRAYPRLSTKLGGDSDIKLEDYSDLKQGDDEQEYDQLPKQQKNAYFSEEVKIPPSFDCDNPTYRYPFLEPTSTFTARPVLDAHGWDHDCGYDGVSMEETLAILNMFPANVAVHVTKDKKEFSIHLDSSVAAKHGENASTFACLDIQTSGHQLAYILRGETKIKSIKKNKTTGGFLVTFLGDTVATGVKLEDKISLGKRLSLVASTGAIRAQGDTGYGANLEACLKGKANPIGQSLSTLGISLMRWRQDLALGANLQSQFSTGRGSKMELRLGLNNKLSGQIGVKTSTSEQIQIALLGLVPIAVSIYKRLQPSEPSLA